MSVKVRNDRVRGNARMSRARLQFEGQLARKWMLRHQPEAMAIISKAARTRYPLTLIVK